MVLKYANMVGPRGDHCVMIDFVKKLEISPLKHEILSADSQRMHLYINRCSRTDPLPIESLYEQS